MVLDKLRKGLRAEPQVVTQLKAHQWTNDAQKKELVDKFLALSGLEPEDVAWTAADQVPEIRAAGLAILRKRNDPAVVDVLLPYLRTRSEAARRGVQRFLKELAGAELPAVLARLVEKGDDFAKLGALELARELPADKSFAIYRKILQEAHPALRARALKAVSEASHPGAAQTAAALALPLLSDDDEEIRLAALAVLEKNPSEELIPHVLRLARSGGARTVEAAMRTLQRLLPVARTDHTEEILPLLGDGNATVRTGAVTLLSKIPPQALATSFVRHFGSAFAWVRDRALAALLGGFPSFVPALLSLTRDPTPEVARAAAELTLSLADARAVPVWLWLLNDPDWWTKSRALEALGKHGASREDAKENVLQALLAALKDPDLRLSAASALGDFGDPRAAGPLFELFKASAQQPDDQLEVLDAMAALGAKEPRVGGVLGQVSGHPAVHVRVREKARRLVGKLQGDAARDALPKVQVAPKAVDLSATPNPTIVDFLADTLAAGASDFHLATGFVPHRRLHGTLEPLSVPTVTAARAEALIMEILSPEEWARLMDERQLDVCVKVPGLGRFRANFFSQRGGLDASFRVVPQEIPTLEELGLPESVWDVTRFTQGLVLVTGPAGCGKSTTLAALLNRVNETRAGHIITIEDPIEFVHSNKESLVNQRQVPQHSRSFARALRASLREDPDVILIGEMRDLETISLAISASETGHLVFGTLNTTTAPGTIDRIINSFPPGQQAQIRTMVADSLKAVISQALLPRRDGLGRVAAFEILRGTPAVSALIRESKTFQLPSVLQTGQLHGMNTMDQALLKLVEEGRLDAEVAMDRATKKDVFEKMATEERLAFS